VVFGQGAPLHIQGVQIKIADIALHRSRYVQRMRTLMKLIINSHRPLISSNRHLNLPKQTAGIRWQYNMETATLPSSLTNIYCRIEAVQFDAGILSCESPMY
jgi:hypothetical protein